MIGFKHGWVDGRICSVKWSSHARERYYRYVTGLIYKADANQWVLLGDMPEFEVGQLLGGN